MPHHGATHHRVAGAKELPPVLKNPVDDQEPFALCENFYEHAGF